MVVCGASVSTASVVAAVSRAKWTRISQDTSDGRDHGWPVTHLGYAWTRGKRVETKGKPYDELGHVLKLRDLTKTHTLTDVKTRRDTLKHPPTPQRFLKTYPREFRTRRYCILHPSSQTSGDGRRRSVSLHTSWDVASVSDARPQQPHPQPRRRH
ncbi:hypothetical protein Hamer_G020469, partial [Homarus americanus]